MGYKEVIQLLAGLENMVPCQKKEIEFEYTHSVYRPITIMPGDFLPNLE